MTDRKFFVLRCAPAPKTVFIAETFEQARDHAIEQSKVHKILFMAGDTTEFPVIKFCGFRDGRELSNAEMEAEERDMSEIAEICKMFNEERAYEH